MGQRGRGRGGRGRVAACSACTAASQSGVLIVRWVGGAALGQAIRESSKHTVGVGVAGRCAALFKVKL